MYDAIFSGPPVGVPSPGGSTVTTGLDKANFVEYVNVGTGWVPVSDSVARSNNLGVTGAVVNLLTYTVPVTGLYQLTGYAAQATSTNGTLPSLQFAYTEADTGAAIPATTFLAGVATTGSGQSESGIVTIDAKAGTTIVISSLAPTTLTANIKTRIAYLG